MEKKKERRINFIVPYPVLYGSTSTEHGAIEKKEGREGRRKEGRRRRKNI